MDTPLGIDRGEMQKHLDAATEIIRAEIDAGMKRYAEIAGQESPGSV